MKVTSNSPLCENTNHVHLTLLHFGHAVVGAEWAGNSADINMSRLYYIVDGETKAGDFNGCESSYHLCDECKECRVKALALFDQDAYVGRPNLERMIAQGFPDLSSIATPEK